MDISNNAKKVLESRYLRKDRYGNLSETTEELFQRVARSISQAELHYENARQARLWEDEFLSAMTALDFLPNSPTLMNAGLQEGQLSACYVLPVQDSMTAIFKTLQDAALIQQSGGGTGFNFSHLRPRGDHLSKGGTASGPVSFMKIYETATDHIKQGGRRRGANMGILNAHHPDIEQFIDVKAKEGGFTNFNLSVGVTDVFIQAVQNNEKWQLIHPQSGNVMRTVNAQRLWAKIIENAWTAGDPGLIFLDAINHSNPTSSIGRIICTNPCGEVPLLPYESCNLGSINLAQIVRSGPDGPQVDWDKLKRLTHTGTRFLDDVLDVNHYLTREMGHAAKGNRKIGLGVMGWAEMLIQLGIPYDSDQALRKGEEVMQFIRYHSDETSKELAQSRGSFPNWEQSIYYPDTPIRNATRISIAPTGSISIIANASSSIEPLFALAYNRKNVLDNQQMTEVNQLFIDKLQQEGLYSEEIMEHVKKQGSAKGIEQIPGPIQELFKTSLAIPYQTHIKHQAVFQQYTDNAVSKTINLAENATGNDVENAYLLAWQQNCKGITIYRNRSKDRQVLNVGAKEEREKIEQELHFEGCMYCGE